MFAFIIAIHVIACVCLIFIVLVQQGKGGGLIDSMSSAESIFGTKTSSFLVKATTIASVVFFLTCLSLAFLSIQRNKSLLETTRKNINPQAPASATADTQKPVEKPKPVEPVAAVPQTASVVNQPVVDQPSEQILSTVSEETASVENASPLADEANQTATTPEVSANADLIPSDPEKSGQ